MEKSEIEQLEEEIIYYNDEYRKGDSKISDKAYDEKIERLKYLCPTHPLLQKNIIEKAPKEREEKLPVKMPSLDKLKSIEEIKAWAKKNNIEEDCLLVLTPKLDGASLLRNLKNTEAWTRGDGEIGQTCGTHLQFINSKLKESIFIKEIGVEYISGEVLFKKKYLQELIDLVGKKITLRNFVSGKFREEKPSPEILKYVDFLPYNFYNKEGKEIEEEKSALLDNFSEITYMRLTLNLLNDEIVDHLYNKWRKIYEIDGLVIEIDDYQIRKKLGFESNGNPVFAKSFKKNWEEQKETEIIGLEVKVSKHGALKPVALLNPIELEGAEVTHVTLYNYKYLIEKNILEGDIILLKRSGGVIPKIVEIYKRDDLIRKPIDSNNVVCPSCGSKTYWNETKVELLCSNPDNCPGVNLAKITEFFLILGVEGISEITLEKIIKEGYNTIEEILNLTKDNLLQVEGFGETSADNFLAEINKLKEGVPEYVLQAASGYFPGLGVKTLQLIYENLGNNLLDVKGIGKITLETYQQNILSFEERFKNNFPIPIKIEKNEIVIEGDSLKGQIISFTGFRDKDLEKYIKYNSGEVKDFSKSTTILLVDKVGGGTSKEIKAGDYNSKGSKIEILSREDFLIKHKINF